MAQTTGNIPFHTSKDQCNYWIAEIKIKIYLTNSKYA